MKRSLKVIICVLLAVITICCPFWFWSNYSIKINEQTIYSDKIQNDIKITLVSDLHGVQFGKQNSKLIKKIEETSPDIILVLGDMYSRNHTNDIDRTITFLTTISEIADVYVITGDHDTDDEYKSKLNESDKINFLNYKKVDITIKNNNISIFGINNVYFTPTFDLNNAFKNVDNSRFNILLSHIPESDLFKNFDADIIFCGDTHGGLIRLPFLGPLYYKGYIFPKITYSKAIIDKGLYQFENQSLFVTSGLGDYPVPLRFNNRPEICAITISKESTK